ncbi:retinol dehydrogenase 13 [Xylariomycetidae sp. FL2044]|nr:retinol dehydrogenase 13 [Xylariomycetidae sp. FL2044]
MNTDKRTVDDLAILYGEHIEGKVIITTGVSPGETASAINERYPNVQVRTLELDLVSQASVRKAADVVNEWVDVPQVDVLVNNAGVMAIDWAASPEGLDSQLAMNHLGPFLFTNLIMGKLLKSKAPRVVNVTSDGHRLSPFRFDDYNFRDGQFYNKWLSYGQSKTANMLMAISLAEKLGAKHSLASFSVQPGLVVSNLGAHLKLFGESDEDLVSMLEIDRLMGNAIGWADFGTLAPSMPDVGANTHVYAAFDPEVTAHNGAYLLSCRVADPMTDLIRPWANSRIEAEKLWKLSEKLVGQEFLY